jgi:GWxTD domain-containing protein
MTPVETWVHTRLAAAIGWTLFHSIWEGAVIALALAVALLVVRSAIARYAAAFAAMLLLLASFGVTFACMMSGPVATAHIDRSHISPAPNGRGMPAAPSPSAEGLTVALPWLAPFWFAGVWIFYLRHLAGWLAARRLRRTGVCCAPESWQDRLAELRTCIGLTRPVMLLESCLAEVPVVIGHLRPMILMPIGLLAGLPSGQIEAILLHELGHIRRCDYLVNVIQRLAEGLLFYHPAGWWISGVIRAERENCCDDLVVATQGNAHEYALALAALEQKKEEQHDSPHPTTSTETRISTRDKAGSIPLFPVAATGGSLVRRIRRLLYPQTRNAALTPFLSAAILVTTAAVALAAWQAEPPKPAHQQASRKVSPYLKWLDEDVVYIITAEERAAFNRLTTDEEREKFIEQFWLRRDPTPGTVENEFKEEHYRRIALVNARYASSIPGWKTDRGRIYIMYGPPSEIESHPSGGTYNWGIYDGGGTTVTFPFERWLYRHIDGIGDQVTVIFVDETGTGNYRIVPEPTKR